MSLLFSNSVCVLPVLLELSRDRISNVRFLACKALGVAGVTLGVNHKLSQDFIIPRLVALTHDDKDNDVINFAKEALELLKP
ncbi:hypothetical protein KIPB_002912 [Kipferlia bialata]|uniref:Uncharacterized protein n=1 Tax=Kipferlia bialata TaxID=797122 RepID=A0A9K3CSL1_9EUKA|nr:hypothetical protein KIPB_002912 [Kipferlia bialata]|eukprot:g2912.t1